MSTRMPTSSRDSYMKSTDQFIPSAPPLPSSPSSSSSCPPSHLPNYLHSFTSTPSSADPPPPPPPRPRGYPKPLPSGRSLPLIHPHHVHPHPISLHFPSTTNYPLPISSPPHPPLFHLHTTPRRLFPPLLSLVSPHSPLPLLVAKPCPPVVHVLDHQHRPHFVLQRMLARQPLWHGFLGDKWGGTPDFVVKEEDEQWTFRDRWWNIVATVKNGKGVWIQIAPHVDVAVVALIVAIIERGKKGKGKTK